MYGCNLKYYLLLEIKIEPMNKAFRSTRHQANCYVKRFVIHAILLFTSALQVGLKKIKWPWNGKNEEDVPQQFGVLYPAADGGAMQVHSASVSVHLTSQLGESS